MKRQSLWKTSITTSLEAEEAVGELMTLHLGANPSSYTDVETGATTVSVYLAKRPANIRGVTTAFHRRLRELDQCGLNIGPGRIQITRLPREDWANSWKRHFPRLEIGSELLIKPGWIKRKPRPGQKLVVLDPGLSFGTGQHPTTGFCLREIVRAARRRPSRSFLDMGTGSGILAIAAAKLRFEPVNAFDYDPQCVTVARTNARRNRVQRRIQIARADLTRLSSRASKQYDLVCANLLANLLIAERDRILARVRPGGTLVVAGILKTEFAEVQSHFEAVGCKLVRSKTEKEWRSGSFVRPT